MFETLEVRGPVQTRVSLVDGIHAVWNTGDKLSVFYDGGDNEQWEYTGADGAASGTIRHGGTSGRAGTGRFTAVWPYDSGASISGDVVSTTVPAAQAYRCGSYGWALLVASTTGTTLDFKYATAFVRLRLLGSGSVTGISLQGNDNEVLAGVATVNVAASSPAVSLSSGTKTLSLSNGGTALETLSSAPVDFWLALVPGTYSNGVTLTVTMDTGHTEVFQVSEEVTLLSGEVLCLYGDVYESIEVDFTSTVFTPSLSNSLSHEQGTHSFSYGGTEYSLTFHPAYDATSYGYGMYLGSFLIGRKDAWIRLPVKTGYALSEVEFQATGTSGAPYISDNTSSPTQLSNKISSSVVDSWYSLRVENPIKNKQYYLMVGSGNLRMGKMVLKYVKKD